MKTIQFLFVLVLAGLRSEAQHSLLIFFEASEKKPFYVKLGTTTTASSATGQVYFTDLSDKKYEIYIGFPDLDPAEHRFDITLARADNSFQLKAASDGRWTLIDLETNKLFAELSEPRSEKVTLRGVRKTDAFAILMAGVVNDSAVLYTSVPPAPPVVATPSVAVAAESKTEPQPATAKRDEVLIDTATAVTPVERPAQQQSEVVRERTTDTLLAGGSNAALEKPDSVTRVKQNTIDSARAVANSDVVGKPTIAEPDTVKVAVAELPTGNRVDNQPAAPATSLGTGITKVDEKRSGNQLELAYTDSKDGKVDTIRIVIAEEPAAKEESIAKIDSSPVKWSANPRPLSAPADTNTGKVPPVMINSDCVNFASEYDVDKLRVKMVSEVTADERIASARKVFKSKCFNSRQVRALTELFLNDEGKFRFLEAAYPFVSDSDGFRKLVDVLTDEVFIGRFKSLVRLQ